MFVVDGSQGEGGGQVLRTSLSLSALTGRPFRIEKIRANRSKPGLRPQHLTAVRAVAALCAAGVEGDDMDATTLEFYPGSKPLGGDYTFDVTEASPSGRSAGSVTLILQAVLWPLLFASRPATLVLKGGTFVPFSPPYHYLTHVAGPAFGRFGVNLDTELKEWGWMTGGGGLMTVSIKPVDELLGVDFMPLAGVGVEGVAAVTNLPSHIPHRMARRAHNLLVEAGLAPRIDPMRERGVGPGAGIIIWRSQAGFSALGRKGLPADKVAEMAVAELLAFVDNGSAVDYHLADQLLVPMVLARGKSSFTTNRLTRHTLTNVNLLRQWLGVNIDVKGVLDQPGSVTVTGIAFSLASGNSLHV